MYCDWSSVSRGITTVTVVALDGPFSGLGIGSKSESGKDFGRLRNCSAIRLSYRFELYINQMADIEPNQRQ